MSYAPLSWLWKAGARAWLVFLKDFVVIEPAGSCVLAPRQFNFLQGSALGLGNQEEHEHKCHEADASVNPEGQNRANRLAVVEHREGLCHNVAGGPNHKSGDG